MILGIRVPQAASRLTTGSIVHYQQRISEQVKRSEEIRQADKDKSKEENKPGLQVVFQFEERSNR
jgi:hypothetical protein